MGHTNKIKQLFCPIEINPMGQMGHAYSNVFLTFECARFYGYIS